MGMGLGRPNRVALTHVALPTAAALVYFDLTGKPPDATTPVWIKSTVNEVAQVMANVMTIYTQDGESPPRELLSVELLGGKFEKGAQVFRTASGAELSRLTVRRENLYAGISILKRAHVRFR